MALNSSPAKLYSSAGIPQNVVVQIRQGEHGDLRLKKKLTTSIALVAEATNEVVRKRSTLAGAAFLPIAGIFLINALLVDLSPSGLHRFALLLVALPLYALFATVVHRVVLLGEQSLPNRWGIFWTERETRFLGWLIGIWFLHVALSFPTGIIAVAFSMAFTGWDGAWVATILGYLVAAYFDGRFGLVLPATAIDRRSSFRESWAMSRGKGMMIAMALVVPAIISMPVEWALYGAVDETFRPMIDLVWMFFVLAIFAVEVAIISLAFSKLSFQDRR